MNQRHSTSLLQRAFFPVKRIGLTLPGVQVTTRYDGCPALTFRGCFLAALADPRWAEPDTLVIRAALLDRELMIQDAPDTYYTTDHHRPHPVVLVRLKAIDDLMLRELLHASLRLTLPKAKPIRRRPARPIRQRSRP